MEAHQYLAGNPLRVSEPGKKLATTMYWKNNMTK